MTFDVSIPFVIPLPRSEFDLPDVLVWYFRTEYLLVAYCRDLVITNKVCQYTVDLVRHCSAIKLISGVSPRSAYCCIVLPMWVFGSSSLPRGFDDYCNFHFSLDILI